jgi:hypothetical protein
MLHVISKWIAVMFVLCSSRSVVGLQKPSGPPTCQNNAWQFTWQLSNTDSVDHSANTNIWSIHLNISCQNQPITHLRQHDNPFSQ